MWILVRLRVLRSTTRGYLALCGTMCPTTSHLSFNPLLLLALTQLQPHQPPPSAYPKPQHTTPKRPTPPLFLTALCSLTSVHKRKLLQLLQSVRSFDRCMCCSVYRFKSLHVRSCAALRQPKERILLNQKGLVYGVCWLHCETEKISRYSRKTWGALSCNNFD